MAAQSGASEKIPISSVVGHEGFPEYSRSPASAPPPSAGATAGSSSGRAKRRETAAAQSSSFEPTAFQRWQTAVEAARASSGRYLRASRIESSLIVATSANSAMVVVAVLVALLVAGPPVDLGENAGFFLKFFSPFLVMLFFQNLLIVQASAVCQTRLHYLPNSASKKKLQSVGAPLATDHPHDSAGETHAVPAVSPPLWGRGDKMASLGSAAIGE